MIITVEKTNEISEPDNADLARITQAKLRAYLRGILGCFEKVGFGKPPENGTGLMLAQLNESWIVCHVNDGDISCLAVFTNIVDAADYLLVELPEFESCISEVSPFQAIVYCSASLSEEQRLNKRFEAILSILHIDIDDFSIASIGMGNVKSSDQFNVFTFENGEYLMCYFERGKKDIVEKFASEDEALECLAGMATYKAAREYCIKHNLDTTNYRWDSPLHKKQEELLATINIQWCENIKRYRKSTSKYN